MSAGRIETATVMFTDLVGSTELRGRVGEAAADELRGAHDELLREAITSAGGKVVKYLGDGAMATFTAASQAVEAAVAFQQAIDVRNRRGGEQLAVRVGISVGDVTFVDDDCHGLPVVTAQRLESAAPPGGILCSDLVMHLSRGRSDCVFREVGELELKGLAEPVAACEVMWERLGPGPSDDVDALPPALARAGGLPFSGRDTHLDALRAAWKRCAVGAFEVVLLAGEPGIGKTRLARQLAKVAREQGATVLAGRCDEDVHVPFQALGSALSWYVEHTPEHELDDGLGRFPGDLVRLVPHLGDHVADLAPPLRSEPEAERYRLMEAVASWLEAGGIDRPRLLVIDDLHWADRPTLLVLRHVIDVAPPGLLIVCTYRDTDVDRAHPLSSMLADLRRLPDVQRVALQGLDSAELQQLLVRTGGHELDEAGMRFAEMVQRETSGNPFFVGEVLRHLAETGALVEREGRWTSDLTPDEAGIPEGIREVVGRRLGRLGDDTEQVLRVAAVIGYEFDIDLIADVMRVDVDDVIDALDDAVAASLAQEVGVDRYRFAHALVRETLHGELSSTRRARQHRRVAEALERRHADDDEAVVADLAAHWTEASAGGDPERAVSYCLRAGRQAIERGAPEAAVGWFEQVVELIEDDDEHDPLRRSVLVDLGSAKIRAGVDTHEEDLDRAARLALDADDIETAVAALLVSARSSFDESQHPRPEKIDLLREAIDRVGDDIVRRASLLGELATELIFVRDIEGRRTAIAELDRLCDRLPQIERGRLRSGPGSFDTSTPPAARELLLADQRAYLAVCDVPYERLQLLGGIRFGEISLGRRAAADVTGEELGRIVEQLNDRFLERWLDLFVQVEAIIDGRVDDTLRVSRKILDEWRALRMPEAITYYGIGTMMARRERGELAASVPAWEAACEGRHPASPTVAGLTYALLRAGRIDEARARFDLVRADHIAPDAGFAASVGFWCEVAAEIGRDDQCRDLLTLVEPLDGLHLVSGGTYLGAVSRMRALLLDRLGHADAADAAFAQAMAEHTEIRTPPFLARTALDWAESLVRRGDTGRAAARLDDAERAVGDLDLVVSRERLADLRRRVAQAASQA